MAKKRSINVKNDDQSGRSDQTLTRIVFAIFLAVAILMLAISIVAAINTGRALSKEKSSPGHVIDFVTRKDEAGQEFYYPVIEFYLPDESLQLVEISEGGRSPAYEKGELVTILYDPDHPLNARIKSTASTILKWTLSIITGVIGAAFLIPTGFIGWALKSHPVKTRLA